MRGKIICLRNGFGFLQAADPEVKGDVFFHARSLDGIAFDALFVGQYLDIDLEQGDKGPRAAVARPE